MGLSEALHRAGHLVALIDLHYSIETIQGLSVLASGCCRWTDAASDPDDRDFIVGAGVVAEIFHDGITADPVLHLAMTRMKMLMFEPLAEDWTEESISDVVAYVDGRWNGIWTVANEIRARRGAPVSLSRCREVAG